MYYFAPYLTFPLNVGANKYWIVPLSHNIKTIFFWVQIQFNCMLITSFNLLHTLIHDMLASLWNKFAACMQAGWKNVLFQACDWLSVLHVHFWNAAGCELDASFGQTCQFFVYRIIMKSLYLVQFTCANF